MKVYVLKHSYLYEGDYIVGIYSNKEAAEKAAYALEQIKEIDDEYYTVREYDLI